MSILRTMMIAGVGVLAFSAAASARIVHEHDALLYQEAQGFQNIDTSAWGPSRAAVAAPAPRPEGESDPYIKPESGLTQPGGQEFHD